MKLTVLVLALSATILAAETPVPTQKPTAESIAKTATLLRAVAEHKREFDALLAASQKAKIRKGDSKTKRLEALRAELHEALSGVEDLKKALQTGQSVSDYPGLLTLGGITYDAATDIYALRFLGGHSREKGIPYHCVVRFDRYGHIESLEIHNPFVE